MEPANRSAVVDACWANSWTCCNRKTRRGRRSSSLSRTPTCRRQGWGRGTCAGWRRWRQSRRRNHPRPSPSPQRLCPTRRRVVGAGGGLGHSGTRWRGCRLGASGRGVGAQRSRRWSWHWHGLGPRCAQLERWRYGWSCGIKVVNGAVMGATTCACLWRRRRQQRRWHMRHEPQKMRRPR